MRTSLFPALLLAPALAGQSLALVRDVRPASFGSYPSEFCELRAGVTLFTANDGVAGRELWRTDGTAAGTTLVRDIEPGPGYSSPSDLERLGDRVLFAATEVNGGTELWASDGTAAGTVMVRDINTLNSSWPAGLTRVRDRVYFSAMDDNFDRELWRSDGTAAGTVRVIDLDPAGSSAPRDLCELGYTGTFVFSADVGGDRELWRSDGTAAGTFLVRDIRPGGTSFVNGMTRCGDKVVFYATDGVNGAELWITDGTFAGTVMLKDIMPGVFDSSPRSFTAADDGRVVFTCDEYFTAGQELWITDGTTAGTMMLAELEPGLGSLQPSHLTWSGNRDIFFRATTATAGSELWVMHGPAASGGSMVADLNPGTADGYPDGRSHGREMFQDSFGRLFLTANDGVHGPELFVVVQGAWSKAMDRPCGTGTIRPALTANPPVLGGTCTFTNQNAPAATITVMALHLGPPAPTALGGGCRNHLAGGLLLLSPWMATPGATWTLPVPVPADPTLAGLQCAAQTVYSLGVILDGWSNGVWLQLGF